MEQTGCWSTEIHKHTLPTAHCILRFGGDRAVEDALHPLCVWAMRHVSCNEIISAWGEYSMWHHTMTPATGQLFTRVLRWLAFLSSHTYTHTNTPREQQLQGSEVASYAWANLVAFPFQVRGSPLKSVRLKGLTKRHVTRQSMLIIILLCLNLVNNPKSTLHSLHTLHNFALKGLRFSRLLHTERVHECSVLWANVEVHSSAFLH